MSRDVDRNQVLQTTRVRTSLKNDVSWIQKAKQQIEEQVNARTDQAVETKPVLVKQNSYVLSTAKKFESVDSPLSPPLQNTQVTPSESNSANQPNGEVIPPLKDAQPQGSTLETTDDIKPQAPTEELIQNDEAQPEESVANVTEDNKQEHADLTDEHSNAELNEGAAEVSADVHVEECVQNGEAQPVSPTTESPDAVPPVDPAKHPVVNTTAENEGENADTAADQSNVEHNEVKVSADAHVEGPVAETSGIEESKDSAEIPAAIADVLKPQEGPLPETEPAIAPNLEDAGVESTVQPAEGSCEECPSEQVAEETVEAAAEVVVESSPNKSDVINATPAEEAVLQDSVEPVPDLLIESVSESPAQPAAETETEGSCENGPPERTTAEIVEAVAEVNVETSPETPAVTEAAGEEAALQPVPDLVADTVSELPESEASAEPVLETRVEEVVESVVQTAANTAVEQSVEPTPESVSDRTVELSIEDALEPATASDADAAQDTFTYRIVELTDALDVEPAASEVAPEPAPEPAPEVASEPAPEVAPEPALEPAPAVAPEPAPEVPPEPAPEVASEPAPEAAPEPAAEVTPEPAPEVPPEPLKDPEQSHTEETKLNPDTEILEMFRKAKEEQQSRQTLNETRDGETVCSFCDEIIGNIKITFSEPLVICHPECLKCGVCAKALGDMLTPMFLHSQVIACDGCFARALKA